MKLESIIPAISWIRNYEKANFQGDLIAGLTTAVMIIPQGMAYAMLAGLPPIMGLYASIVPILAYALFGSSRQLAVGPVAMDSLLVFASVSAIATVGTDQYIAFAIALAFIAGFIQILMGVFRLGFLVNFLSKPVIAGFTASAALIIGFSQLKDLLGIEIQRTHHIYKIVLSVFEHFQDISFTTLIIATVSIALLVFLKRRYPRFPRALGVVVLGALVTYFFDFAALGLAVVGDVPPGFPAPTIPSINMETLELLLPTALIVALVGFMEAISISKGIATKHRYEIDANQELIGIGMANVAAGLFHGYTVTGGFSRTAVNDSSGAKTPLASMITAGIVAITLLYFTPLFYFLPRSVLAAIIMTAVLGLIDIPLARRFWKVKRSDFALYGITFFATIGFGIVIGLGAGVIASLILFVAKTTKPHFAVLGRVPNTTAYRKIENYEEAEIYLGVLILRIDAQFYFGNINFLKSTISEQMKTYKPIQRVILDMSGVNEIDASGEAALCEIKGELGEDDVDLIFANLKRPVREVLERADLCFPNAPHVFLTVHDAVKAVEGLEVDRRSHSSEKSDSLLKASTHDGFKEAEVRTSQV